MARQRNIGGFPAVIFRVWGTGKSEFILESATDLKTAIGATGEVSLQKLGEALVSKKAEPWACSLSTGEALIVPAGYVSW